MPEKKPGPCAADKIVKGNYCADCKKDLADADLKAGACSTCEKKPVRAEYCVKSSGKTQDRARVTYECAGCAQTGEFEADVKHADDCRKKSAALKKICTRSGTSPHQSLPK